MKQQRSIQPRKLCHSKWTAAKPVNKEKHFMVTSITFDEAGEVEECLLEAVFTKRVASIDWQDLNDEAVWHHGWL